MKFVAHSGLIANPLVPAICVVLLCSANPVNADSPEPDDMEVAQGALALLRGVENARASVVAGKIELETEFRGDVAHNRRRYTVFFNRDRWRFDAGGGTVPMKSVATPVDLIHFDGAASCTIREP